MRRLSTARHPFCGWIRGIFADHSAIAAARQGLVANEKIGANLATSLVEEGYGMTLSDLFGSQNGHPNAHVTRKMMRNQ